MTAKQKYIFETRFDRGAAPAPPRKHYSAAEYDAARKESESAGYAAGQAAVKKEIDSAIARASATIAQQIPQALATIRSDHDRREQAAIGAAIEIVKRLFPSLTAHHELTEIEGLVRECLTKLHDEPRVVVRIAESILDRTKPGIDSAASTAGFPGQVVIIADPTLADGEARVEWADGGAERDPESLWKAIDEILARHRPASSDSTHD
jgi:flagellar assembly protein FliH